MSRSKGKTMIINVLRVIATGLLVTGLESSVPMAQAVADTSLPAVPVNLEVPSGHSLFLSAHAVGTQNYVCLPSASGVSWRFFAPEATLFHTVWGSLRQQLATHFLSPNPDEGELPRPTWQHPLDSSRVWGRLLASSSDPAYVEEGAIPWFLLAAAGTEAGPTGGGVLTQTAYIQRLNTSGGVAPPTGCSEPTEVGTIVLVPYSADYRFYKADRRRR